MRLFYLLITLVLIAALVVPFYMKGPNGQPVMTLDKVIDDNTPEVMIDRGAYRWQDEHGRWHFSDEPIDGKAERFEMGAANTFESNWSEQAAALEAEQPAISAGMPSLGDVYDGDALEKAQEAAGLIEQRTQALEGLLGKPSEGRD